MDRFHDRTALVTGASKGIGRAIAIRLASEGAHVAVNFNEDEDGAGRVVEQIIACGGNAFPVQADVGAPGDIEAMFTVIAEKLGRLDVLVNNAGIYRSRPIEELDAAEFDRHFHTNVLGGMMAVQAAMPLLNAGSAILFISSTASTQAPALGSVYSATKGAVTSVIKSLAKELAPSGIRVNGVSPGFVRTEGVALAGMIGTEFEQQIVAATPLARAGRPEDIAAAAAFLTSYEADFITGEVLVVSGGQAM